jgi:ABC-type multidrug transport system fused ATPase/permease subunit
MSRPEALSRLEQRFLRPYRAAIALSLAGVMLQSALLVPIPMLQGRVLDRLADAWRSGESTAAHHAFRFLFVSTGIAIASIVARAILVWRCNATMGRVSLEAVRSLTDAMHRSMQSQPLEYFERESAGSLISRITSDVGSLLIFLSNASLQLLCDLLLAGCIAAALVWIDIRLAFVAFAILPLHLWNFNYWTARNRKLAHAVRTEEAGIVTLLCEKLSAMRLVRSFAQEALEIDRLGERLDAHDAIASKSLTVSAWQNSAGVLLSGVGVATTLFAGSLLIGTGGLTAGQLVSFYALLGLFYAPMLRLTQFQGILIATRVAAERIDEVLQASAPMADGLPPLLRQSVRGELVLRDLSFRYLPTGRPALQGVRLSVRAGMKVGILGGNGAGKSTLLSLIPRLYELAPGQGSIELDGRNLRDFRLRDVRRSIVLVPQQAFLFEGTLRSNLTYARPDASERDLREAIEVAELSSLVEALPQGLDTHVSEGGTTFSGGQRQRLALARAILADPAVLLLDDCTSALDAGTEARVHAALDAWLDGRTCLIAGHKAAAMMDADWIVVMKEGAIVEQGSPADLLAAKGEFALVHEVQSHALTV